MGNSILIAYLSVLLLCAGCTKATTFSAYQDPVSSGEAQDIPSDDDENPDDDEDPVAPPASSDTSVYKPYGAFTSKVTDGSLDNPVAKGALVRAKWEQVEPNPGEFDFSDIDNQIADIKARGKQYSLAVLAGYISPAWLIDDLGVDYFEVIFHLKEERVPKFWDEKLQNRLAILAEKLAERYGDDEDLVLVYVPQLTLNGVEGHFNGMDREDLEAVGFTDERWIDAGVAAARSFAQHFSKKALAYEVHELPEGEVYVPQTIIETLWNDPTLNQRVGAAAWWLAGRDDYNSLTLNFLAQFTGDKYAQIIGNSSQDCYPNFSCTDNMGKVWEAYGRFPNGGYTSVFEQAKAMGFRYMEPWNYEFENNTYDDEISEFNNHAEQMYGE